MAIDDYFRPREEYFFDNFTPWQEYGQYEDQGQRGMYRPAAPPPSTLESVYDPIGAGFDMSYPAPIQSQMQQPAYTDPFGGANDPVTGTPFSYIPPIAPNPMTDERYMADRYRQLYQPEHVATDWFNRMIGQYPQRGRPSLGRTLVASGMAATRPKEALEFMERPYMRDIESWKQQITPAYQAANLERQANINERTIANQIITQELAGRKQTEVERYNRERNKIAQDRADVYRMKSMGYKFDFRGPTVIATSPTNPTPIDTKFPTGQLSEYDKIMLQADITAGQIAQRGNIQAGIAAANQVAATGRAEMNNWIPFNVGNNSYLVNTGTGQIRNIGVSGAPVTTGGLPGPLTRVPTPSQTAPSETQAGRGYFNRAQQLKNSRPDLAPFIKLAPNNVVTVTPPGKGFLGFGTSGPTPGQHAEITTILGGATTPQGQERAPSQAPTTPQQGQPLVKEQRSPSGQSRMVRSRDGGKTWSEASYDNGKTWQSIGK